MLAHSPVDGPVDCFYVEAIVHKASANIHVPVFVWTCVETIYFNKVMHVVDPEFKSEVLKCLSY